MIKVSNDVTKRRYVDGLEIRWRRVLRFPRLYVPPPQRNSAFNRNDITKIIPSGKH